MNTDLQKQEYLLNEYFQAVDSYQKAVLDLKTAREGRMPNNFSNLLARADAAKYTLNCCRDRYRSYCAIGGTTGN